MTILTKSLIHFFSRTFTTCDVNGTDQIKIVFFFLKDAPVRFHVNPVLPYGGQMEINFGLIN